MKTDPNSVAKSQSKLNKERSSNESDPLDRNLECPPELPPLARQEWNRIVGELTALGILSRFDRGPLAVYCGAYFLWAEAMDALQKYGTMIKSPNGYPVQSPYLATLNRQAEGMMRLAGEFGFTPAARSRNFSYSKSKSMLLEASHLNLKFAA
jgi:P27 family predicted phage terminase small subunit